MALSVATQEALFLQMLSKDFGLSTPVDTPTVEMKWGAFNNVGLLAFM